MNEKTIQARFYRSKVSGNEPVRIWLKKLPVEYRKRIGMDIKAVEWKWPQGLPLVRKIDNDLWEIRSKLPNGIARTFFTVWQSYLVLLHGFIKKTQKTPVKEIDIAKKRRDNVKGKGV